MRKNIFQYYKEFVKTIFEIIINLLLFFPYFFSITTIIKTFYAPWKNLYSKKNVPGFSFNELINRVFFNLISRTIGMFMRLSLLIFYFIFQVAFLIFIPLFITIALLSIPIFYFFYLFEKTEEEKKSLMKSNFINRHTLKTENRQIVEQWFEIYHQKFIRKKQWWKLVNLFAFPPLARDWAVGFTPIIDQFSTDLCASEYQKKMKNIFDREKEIKVIERFLSKSEESNVIVIGEEGVGKHTIIDAFAKKIYEGRTNSLLAYKRILKLNIEKILSQYTDQKQRENFFEILLKEATEAKNIILLIDDIHRYLSNDQGNVDLASSFEKFAYTNSIQIIGITTPFYYQKFIFSNDKINRYFSKVDVYEITPNEAEQILLYSSHILEDRYLLTIPYETLKETIEKSDYFITYIPFPEKAIELLDDVCVYTKDLKKGDTVLPEHVNIVLSEKTHVPTILSEEMKKKLLSLSKLLSERIIQQPEAVSKVSSVMNRSFILIGKRKKPLGTFLFIGPTGVGKTLTAKTIADIFFGSDKHLIRFDMSNYQLKEDIPKLIGANWENQQGLLANIIREKPYGVLLLDEIEKANKDLLNIFLTILDEGYFTDGFGKKVDCKNLIVIATSNAGSELIYQEQTQNSNLIDFLIAQHIFIPEFLNRFDGIVEYKQLSKDSIKEIARKLINDITENIWKLHKIKLNVKEETLSLLVADYSNLKFGARNMERVIREKIEDKLAMLIIENKIKEGDSINL